MNRIRHLRKKNGLSVNELAELADLDYSAVAMAEREIGHTHLRVRSAIAEAFDLNWPDLYVNLPENLQDYLDRGEEDERILYTSVRDKDLAEAMTRAGLDPESAAWCANIALHGGNELQFRISSPDMKRIIREAQENNPPREWFYFYTEGRVILARVEAIRQIRFIPTDSCKPFYSEEEGATSIFVMTPPQGTLRYHLEPSLVEKGCLAPFVDTVMKGNPSAPFLSFGESFPVLLSSRDICIAEIPLSFVYADWFEEDETNASDPLDTDLLLMESMGTA